MIRTTPFHERLSALNETGLWEHWSSYLTATRYQSSDKFEYFAIRNAAGLFDTSPLYKYRIHGPDAERFLAGVLARDIRTCLPGHAQYTLWCDDAGFVVEDGVILRHGPNEFVLTAAEPNLAYFAELIGRLDVGIEEISDDWAVLSVQGPRSRALLTSLAPAMAELPYFGLTTTSLARVPVHISRTGFTGDLGYEVWVPASDALTVFDAIWAASRGQGIIPIGMTALYMARIEAGLVLLDVDFHSSRYAWTDADRTTPIELGLGWMFRDLATDGRTFIGSDAIRRELRDKTSRWKLTGLSSTGGTTTGSTTSRADPAQGPHPDPGRVLHLRRRAEPARLRHEPDVLADAPAPHRPGPRPARSTGPGLAGEARARVNHRYEYFDAYVTRPPLFNPERRTA